jgi:fructose-1,6-bisphosphatase I
MVGAMYITYGPLITMVYSAGKGTHEFVLNREGEYVLSEENITLDEKGSIYSLGGLRKDWFSGHLKFVETLEGEGYKLRYSGGFVPDINQILIKRGGVFTYPGTKKDPKGKLRLIFELQPMAFLTEQAGGMATDGKQDILAIKPEGLDHRDLHRKPLRSRKGEGVPDLNDHTGGKHDLQQHRPAQEGDRRHPQDRGGQRPGP